MQAAVAGRHVTIGPQDDDEAMDRRINFQACDVPFGAACRVPEALERTCKGTSGAWSAAGSELLGISNESRSVT